MNMISETQLNFGSKILFTLLNFQKSIFPEISRDYCSDFHSTFQSPNSQKIDA